KERNLAMTQRDAAYEARDRGPHEHTENEREGEPRHASCRDYRSEEGSDSNGGQREGEVDQTHHPCIDEPPEVTGGNPQAHSDNASNDGHARGDEERLLQTPQSLGEHISAERVRSHGVSPTGGLR